MSKVSKICITENSGSNMKDVSSIEVVANKGIVNDRYFNDDNDLDIQITLIEKQRLLEIFSVDQMLIKEIKILQYEIQRRKATVIAERQFKSIPESEIPFWKKHSLN